MYTAWWIKYVSGDNSLNKNQIAEIDQYCSELDCLHLDLERIMKQVKRVPKVTKARTLSNIRWALAYHLDNFYFRVSAYREKLYKLVELILKIKAAPDSCPSRLDAILQPFKEDEIIRAIKHRHAFAHSLGLYWETNPSLAPIERLFDEVERVDPDMAEKDVVRQLASAMHLDGLQKEKPKELSRVCRSLDKVREEICAELATLWVR